MVFLQQNRRITRYCKLLEVDDGSYLITKTDTFRTKGGDKLRRKRKSSKEVHATKLQVQSITQAEADAAATAPPVKNWSATMPAYCLKELRIPARQQKKESGEKSPE